MFGSVFFPSAKKKLFSLPAGSPWFYFRTKDFPVWMGEVLSITLNCNICQSSMAYCALPEACENRYSQRQSGVRIISNNCCLEQSRSGFPVCGVEIATRFSFSVFAFCVTSAQTQLANGNNHPSMRGSYNAPRSLVPKAWDKMLSTFGDYSIY